MIDTYAYNQVGNPWRPDCVIVPFPPSSKLARAYFIFQKYTTSFPPKEALYKGTMFPDLYSPWPSRYKKGI